MRAPGLDAEISLIIVFQKALASFRIEPVFLFLTGKRLVVVSWFIGEPLLACIDCQRNDSGSLVNSFGVITCRFFAHEVPALRIEYRSPAMETKDKGRSGVWRIVRE